MTFSFLLLIKCEDEVSKKREYPRLNTMIVSGISEQGATFKANLYSLGTETILNYGFVWGTIDEPRLTDNKIYLDSSPAQGIFSAGISTTLKKNVEYSVRPFVQTTDHVVYGKTVSFRSLGSNAPVISYFMPESAAWEDTLTIFGKNFSWVARDNIVMLNDIHCTTLSASDTMIKVLVNSDLSALRAIVSVELAQNKAVLTTDTFKLKPPVLYDYYPKQAFWGDTLYLKGKDITALISRPGNFFKLGNVGCTLVSTAGDSICMYKVPAEITEVKSQLHLKINSLELTSPVLFELLPPSFRIGSSKEGTWGDVISLDGKFHPVTTRNTFLFNGIAANVISTAVNQVKIKVPVSLSSIKSAIEYKVTPFAVICQDTFLLKAPVIRTINPLTGSAGSLVTINGNYFSLNLNQAINTKVLFGTVQATISGMNDSTITVIVPVAVAGPVKITVRTMQQSVVSQDNFVAISPFISRVSPLSGTFNDEITVETSFNTTLNSTYAYFNNIPAPIARQTSASVVIKVPIAMDSLPRTIRISSGSISAVSSEKFTLSPHEIFSVSASEALPGQDITITGVNFNPDPSKINVRWGSFLLSVKRSTPNEIVATWPISITEGNYPLSIFNGGYVRKSTPVSYSFTSDHLNPGWTRIGSPEISSAFYNGSFNWGMSILGNSVNGNGYLCSPGSGKMFKFSPFTGSWTEIPDYPFYGVGGMTSVVCRDTLFYICGFDYGSGGRRGMSLFNEGFNTWKKVSDSPQGRQYGFAFSLNEKIYMGSSVLALSDPLNNYNWTTVGSLPREINGNCAASFSLNEKGYILYNNNEFWMFDPGTNLWVRKNDFPGTARSYATSFVVAGIPFLGTGYSAGVCLSDIWRYNTTDDSWTKVTDIPVPRCKATSFTINDKAYVGYGVTTGVGIGFQLYDFYEFDPSML